MYKDKDRQREANRQAKARQRAKDIELAVAQRCDDYSMTNQGVTVTGSDTRVIPERTAQGNIRVSKPGDADYVPQCETTRAFIEDRPKRPEPKRGKDIKCFTDLPPDVQWTIVKMSTTEGRLDLEDKAKRTTRAIHYQRLFPDSWYSKSKETTAQEKKPLCEKTRRGQGV